MNQDRNSTCDVPRGSGSARDKGLRDEIVNEVWGVHGVDVEQGGRRHKLVEYALYTDGEVTAESTVVQKAAKQIVGAGVHGLDEVAAQQVVATEQAVQDAAGIRQNTGAAENAIGKTANINVSNRAEKSSTEGSIQYAVATNDCFHDATNQRNIDQVGHERHRIGVEHIGDERCDVTASVAAEQVADVADGIASEHVTDERCDVTANVSAEQVANVANGIATEHITDVPDRVVAKQVGHDARRIVRQNIANNRGDVSNNVIVEKVAHDIVAQHAVENRDGNDVTVQDATDITAENVVDDVVAAEQIAAHEVRQDVEVGDIGDAGHEVANVRNVADLGQVHHVCDVAQNVACVDDIGQHIADLQVVQHATIDHIRDQIGEDRVVAVQDADIENIAIEQVQCVVVQKIEVTKIDVTDVDDR